MRSMSALYVVCLCALGGQALAAEANAPRPNILFIMADDIGWGDFQCYNPQGKVPTPNIDRLAREGMRFTDAHTPAALCAPTRYAVATGNYTWRGRLPGGTWGWNQTPQFLPGQKTVGHLLQAAGYRTGLFGKLHFGGEFEPRPDGRPDFTRPMKTGPIQWGFDYSYVLLGGHQGPPYMFFENNRVAGDAEKVTQLEAGPLNGGVVPTPGPGLPDWDSRQVGQTLVEKALAFIDQSKDKPFYIHLSTDGAHGPYTPPDTLLGTPVKGESKMTPKTDMAYEVDVVVGKFVAGLEQRGLIEQTLLVVTSDNGGIPADRAQGHDAVGGLHGSKSHIWEGGHRVPFLVQWKGHVPADTVRHQVIGTHDIVPTFVALAGGRFEPDQMLDSVSLAPVFLGQRGDDQPVRQTLLIQSSPGRDALAERDPELPKLAKGAPKRTARERQAAQNKVWNEIAKKGAKSGSDGMAHALREGPWKLVFDIEHDKPAALFNLTDDLAEQKNLIAEPAQADRIQRMEKLYREIRASQRSVPVVEAPTSAPTLANVAYGSHERQVLDFYKAESNVPTPVLFFIHGGGWVGGDKAKPGSLRECLQAGISVVSINYRYVWQAQLAGAQPPVEWPLHDAARALQFVRSKAGEWNIDKARIGASGGSAGACSSLWLAFHPDLADAQSEDPVARESTRLWCAAVNGAQTSLDPAQLKEWTPNSRYGGHAFGFMDPNDRKSRDTRFEEFLAAREQILPWIREYSPYEHVSSDDPPVYLFYSAPPAIGQEQKDPTHTANYGVKLQEKCRLEGVECELVYPGAPDVRHAQIADFLIDRLKAPAN